MRIRFLAAYTIDTLESSFRKRQFFTLIQRPLRYGRSRRPEPRLVSFSMAHFLLHDTACKHRDVSSWHAICRYVPPCSYKNAVAFGSKPAKNG
jgi:hypothetical protein